MNESKYHLLCTKAITGEISGDEQRQLKAWLKRTAENQAYYEQLVDAWDSTSLRQPEKRPNIDAEWASLVESLDLQPVLVKGDKKVSALWPSLRSLISAIAYKPRPVFALAGLLIVSVFAYKLFFDSSNYAIATGNKQRKHLELFDGSQVHINNASSLRYTDFFSDSLRKVELSGEAFFTVARDSSRPFVVITENARITVLGTQFNVWSRDDKTLVTVKEGRVKFSSLISDDGVELTAGQMSHVSGQLSPIDPQMVNIEPSISWIEGRLVFEQTALVDVVARLQRSYDVSINLPDTTLHRLTLTATCRESDPIDSILSSLCLALGLQYHSGNGIYTITK